MRANRQVYDVIIVGAGPAGCMAAHFLPGDFKILMVDAALLPGEKICGGLLNQEARNFLERFKLPDKLYDSPRRLTFRYVDGDRLIDKETGLLLYNISRQKFNAWLLSLLPERAELWQETFFLGYRDYGKYVEVELKRGPEHMTVMTRYLIGADGARSLIRRQMDTNNLRYYTVLQDWIKPEKPLPPYFDCVFSNTLSPEFVYGYIFPKGRLAVAGSIFYPEARSTLATHEKIKKMLKDKIGRFTHLTRRESGVAFYLHSVEDILLGRGRVLLAGEAAGFISPTSGEGISYALASGEVCGMAFWSNKNPLEQYSQLAVPVLDDIQTKLGKLHFMKRRFSRAVAVHMPARVLSWLSKRL